MNIDFFQSHTISFILSWIFSIPILIGLLAALISMLFEKQEGVPRLFLLWILLCIIVLSPARYMLLQYFVATVYPFQSISALFSSFYLIIIIPIVYSILYAIGLGLPLFAAIAVAIGFKNAFSKVRLFVGAVTAPFIFLLGSFLFYAILPYAAYSTHMLKARDLIRATNGPAEFVYKYVVEKFTPQQFPQFAHNVGLANLSSKERLRAHVAAVYLGNKQFSYYVHKAYPKYAESQKRSNRSGNLTEVPQKWPKLTKEEQTELNAVAAKMMREPLEKQDLERVRRIHKSYTKRTGRPITKHEVKLMTQATETLCQYNYEIGGCLLQSIDTKKPYISDELKRLRGKMEDLGYARKSKLDADFRQIVSAANNEVWTDEFGKQFYPLKREDVLKGIDKAKMVNENFKKWSEALLN